VRLAAYNRKRKKHKLLVIKSPRVRPLERTKPGCEDNIKISLSINVRTGLY
jgi:hypothetical protein